jgi:hypothetical protein
MLQPDGNWVRGFLSLPVEHEPGAPFVYNSGASYMLSAIVQKVTGMPLQDYLQPRLFAPLGIQDPAWLKCPRGVNIGGWGLSLTSEEIARFGQLYLQQGQWHGKQILPETWVTAATAKQVPNGSNPDNDWEQGYGFQFWRCRHGGYRGDGAFGQFCIVLPDQDAVLAITSGLDELQPVLDLVWETLLPAFSAGSLPPDAAAQPELSRRLAGLAYLPPHGGATSPLAAGLAGKTFPLGGNDLGADAAEFEFSAENGAVSFRVKGAWHRLAYDAGQWLEGTTLLFGNHAQKVLASGIWAQPDTLEITTRLVETPFCFTLRCAFKDGHLNLSWQPNVKLDDRLMSHLFESTLNG